MSQFHLLKPLDNQLVFMGMSCVGKTELANLLKKDYGYRYYSFDAQYDYRKSRLPGFSHRKNWQRIIQGCEGKFVLDNWTTEDSLGQELYSQKPEACLVVLFDHYFNILQRYRVQVKSEDAHRMMFEKMYKHTPFEQYKKVRYLAVEGDSYREYDCVGYREWIGKVNLNLKINVDLV